MTSSRNVPPVVLAVDGTSGHTGALRYAVQEARLRQSELTVVHVIPIVMPMAPLRPVVPVDLEPNGREVLARTAGEIRDVAPGLAVLTTLVRGSRVGGIVEVSRDAQLVVMGRESRTGMARLLTGATTAGVASHAHCPVVAVPDTWEPRDGARKVLVGFRTPADAPDLMGTAFAWASSRGASVTVLHAWEMADPYLDRLEIRAHAADWIAHGTDMLNKALVDWREAYPDVEVETRVAHGQPAAVLLAAAADADLLVVRRAHEHRPIDHLGSTVRALLLATPTPVEVVPTHSVTASSPGLLLEVAGGLTK